MFGVGTQEILLILLVVLLLFGGKRIPEVARALGKGLGDFRRAVRDVQREIDLDLLNSPEPPPRRTVTKPKPTEASKGTEKPGEPEKRREPQDSKGPSSPGGPPATPGEGELADDPQSQGRSPADSDDGASRP